MPIRILLIDDKAQITHGAGGRGRTPALPAHLSPYFELAWIQNAVEGKWLLDTFDLVASKVPLALGPARLPPEILIFDYALTEGGAAERFDDDPDNIIPLLERVSEEAGCALQWTIANATKPASPSSAGEDRYGCFVGGQLARAFAEHPCGAVPTTAHIDVTGTDAAFYEWLNAAWFDDLFKVKHRSATWETLIPLGVKALRKRMISLAQSGSVQMDLGIIDRLSSDPKGQLDGSFVFWSRYGQRELPIKSLFADFLLIPHSPSPDFARIAREWANEILKAVFESDSPTDFREAQQLAERYHRCFEHRGAQRYELSALARKAMRGHLSDEEWNTIKELCQEFKADFATIRSLQNLDKMKLPDAWGHIGNSSEKDQIVRWAVLMLVVRMAQDSAEQIQLLTGVIDGETLDHEDEFYVNDLILSRYTVMQRIDPLPESLIAMADRFKDGSDAISSKLKHLGLRKGAAGWGSLGLSIPDLLASKEWNAEHQTYGLKSNERKLLQAYALQIGFHQKQKWPPWLGRLNAHSS